MMIKIDSREKARKARAKDFYNAKGHTVTIERLDVGDYLFDDNVVFEYKEISDFMSSIKDNSVFNEASNQSMKYCYHYVIIVGALKRYVTSNWNYARQRDYPKYVHDNYAMYYGALRRLRTFTNVIIVETENEAFNEMLLQSEKCLDGKSRYYSNIVRKVRTNNAILTFLTCIPGVSLKKAEAIIEEYDIETLADLLDLDEEKLVKIKGIGDTTVNKIMSYINVGLQDFKKKK